MLDSVVIIAGQTALESRISKLVQEIIGDNILITNHLLHHIPSRINGSFPHQTPGYHFISSIFLEASSISPDALLWDYDGNEKFFIVVNDLKFHTYTYPPTDPPSLSENINAEIDGSTQTFVNSIDDSRDEDRLET